MNKAPLLTENKIKAAADINCASAVLFQLIFNIGKFVSSVKKRRSV